jgi:MFS family permease
MSPASPRAARPFFGAWVVRAAFILALFGWGVGFYGPPIFLHAVVTRTAWPLELVSFAVTAHFLLGAIVVAFLPRIHRRFGIPLTTVTGAVATSVGIAGWAIAREPWQLFAAALFSGGGWVTMGAAAINAVISPWYSRGRPLALAKAYNGASIGGVIFSPLWVALIALAGFATASAIVGAVMIAVVTTLVHFVFSKSPELVGQLPDGDDPDVPVRSATSVRARPLPGRQLWLNRQFLTLAAGMALGLFAQVGLIAHLFSLLVPSMGAQFAGLTMGLATACAMAGRIAVARLMSIGADRRLVAAASYALQLIGTLVLLASSETQVGMILLGVVLFGSGIGNATSLPPLVIQVEFDKEDVQRVVALVVAIGQATYAFAPLAFGVLIAAGGGVPQIGHNANPFFIAVMVIQAAAIACFLAGRHRD